VDRDTRHGHKSSARGFDGYKGHTAIDPDSEIITATTATAGNIGDADAATDLIADLLNDTDDTDDTDDTVRGEPGMRPRVYGDAAYGTGEFQQRLGEVGIVSRCKTQTPSAAGGMFPKDRFDIDLGALSVTCPAGESTSIRPARNGDGSGIAYFGSLCAGCRLRVQCTTAKNGRTITVGAREQTLAQARVRQADPAWIADYRATRPKIERKLGHLMRRRHGGRRARVRGTDRVDADFRLLAAAVNLARLAVLGLRGHANGWATA
jgi:hypothetical protein